jgi:hypothetical protein
MKKHFVVWLVFGLLCAPAAHGINDGVDFLALKPAPASSAVVDAPDGTLNLGWFAEPFQIVNPEAAFPGILKKLRRKQWQFFLFASQHRPGQQYRAGILDRPAHVQN